MRRGVLTLSLSVALVVFVVGAFFPCLENHFVNYDDPPYVTANPHVQQGLTWPGVVWAFRTGETANWHPLTWLVHMSEWELFGPKAWGYHLTSVLLHGLNTVLVFLVFRRMTHATWCSFFLAAFFGLHPLRVESVAWVAEQKDLLSAGFGLLALWAYVRYTEAVSNPQSTAHAPPEKSRWIETKHPGAGKKAEAPAAIKNQSPSITGSGPLFYLLSLAFLVLSLMSKPMLVTLPFVMLLLDYWPLGRFREVTSISSPAPVPDSPAVAAHPGLPSSAHVQTLVRLAVEKVPFLVLALASSLVTFLVQQHAGAVATLSGTPVAARLANAVVSYCLYLAKLVWPLHLAVFYPYPRYLSIASVLAAAALLVGVSALAVVLRKKIPYFVMGWFWFLGTMVPVIGVVQVGAQSMADRYSYFPSIGLAVLLVWGATAVTASWHYQRAGAASLASLLLLVLSLLTRQQTRYWHDSGSLFRHALEVTGGNATVYWHLGDYDFLEQGRPAEALEQYRQALKFDPSQPDVHFQLANALFRQGARDQAVLEYQEALKYRPGWARAHNNFGFVLENMGRLDEAITHLQEAVKLEPASAEAQSNLGRVLCRTGRTAEGISHLQRAVALNPGIAEIHLTLGMALETTGRTREGLGEFEEAVRLQPAFGRAHFSLALGLLKEGRREEALLHLKEAVRLEPGFEPAQRQLQALER